MTAATRTAILLFALMPLVLLDVSASAQQRNQGPVELISGSTCRQCRIEPRPVVTLGDTVGIGMLDHENNWLARDSRGRYFAYAAATPFFWVFDSHGEAIRRIGGRGEGPGEFRSITSIVVDHSDSVLVFDGALRRLSVFAPSLDFSRTFVVSVSDAAPRLVVGSRLVFRGGIRSADRIGQPLHLVGRAGEIIRSFGSDTPLYRPDLREIIEMREVGTADNGGLWSAWWNQYLIERWDTAGHMSRALKRSVEWFQTWWQPERDAETAPVPVITGVLQAGDTLWVLVRVADPRWRSAVEPAGHLYRVTHRNGYYDTVAEAIDLRARRVIASTRLPIALVGFINGRSPLVYAQDVDQSGNPVIPVWELRIVRP
jgi:hypothetical protein